MRWAIVIAASTMLGSCSAADDKGAKERQVAAFHRDYGAGRFAAIYDASSPSLKAITPPAEVPSAAEAATAALSRAAGAPPQSR